jgi:hypothetical protein
MADDFLGYQNPDTVDEKLDTESLTVGANDVHRERIQVAGTGATDVAPVDGTAGLKVNLGADNDVTVAGTVTAELSATDNAVLDDIAADTESIKTAVEILDNAISGSEIQADVITLPSIPSGTNIIGRVGHDITGIGHGVTTVTTAGTDVTLAASTACKRVVIQSQTDNTSLIAVGGIGVDATIATGNGIILYPGDSFELEIDNLADVFIDSLVNGEGVRYCYFS